MTPKPLTIATLLAALLAAWQPSKALAGNDDTQLWQVVFLTAELDADTRVTIDASQRWREDRRGGDQQALRVTFEQTAMEGVRIGGGAAVFEAGGQTELRPHQQVVLALGRLELRTRFEQRFFDGAERAELRLRQRIQFNQPLGGAWRASVGGEWLGVLRPRSRAEEAASDQWRAQAGIAFRLNERLEVGANYWLLVFPDGPGPTRFSHVPQTVVTYRF